MRSGQKAQEPAFSCFVFSDIVMRLQGRLQPALQTCGAPALRCRAACIRTPGAGSWPRPKGTGLAPAWGETNQSAGGNVWIDGRTAFTVTPARIRRRRV
ncbi:hypothetical protein CBM2592_B110106 [Cupriavidus taiwanensis]|nr:hypothetical protein CBM2592_B110106 [Cupriavidus taiwanensis]SOY63642.1 hypothetical protein CBM2588_B140101 [Cupriavidus taiwanensis]SOY93772.1 hypothetical protein CBM2591_B100079 [Cupriavidus taiwanensis]SOZ85452.1 hypothetical protein CBM2618_B130193 [Cupriavidus taiwanensis]SOZ88826.1 hypothetical protein CBM2622_B140195 [Cupriavidus taiwanensis]